MSKRTQPAIKDTVNRAVINSSTLFPIVPQAGKSKIKVLAKIASFNLPGAENSELLCLFDDDGLPSG